MPFAYVKCMRIRVVPPWASAGGRWILVGEKARWEIEAGHCPNVRRPEVLGGLFAQAVERVLLDKRRSRVQF